MLAPKIFIEKVLTRETGCDIIKTQKTKGARKMKKVTLKRIKEYDKLGLAKNINNASEKELEVLKLNPVFYSMGVYGINGALFKDENNDLYTITAKCSNLFKMI